MESRDKIISQKGFDISWELKESKTTENNDEFCSPREWQTEAFDLLKDSSHIILNAPMGSGKSWMMCLLSAYKMQKNSSLRCIIAVPQTIIASGFMRAKFLLPNEEKLVWSPLNNLCDEDTKFGTTKYVIRWLEGTQIDLNDRTLICTHATLVAVYKQLIKKEKLSLFENILLWIDEAHHAKTSFVKGDNNLGSLINDLIKKEDLRVELGLTTATFFRGDRHSLISQDIETLFVRYNLPYDQYLMSMKYLKSFNFDFIICGKDYMKALAMILDQRKAKDIIYIPKPKSRHSKGCKYSEVNEIIDIYRAKEKSNLIEDQKTGLTLLHSPSNNIIKILDLVDEDQRAVKKTFIFNKELQEDKDYLDVILALDMFKEGANWIFADRCIIVGPRGSLVDVIQMIGRLFRDAKDKEHVGVIQLLPFSVSQNSEDLMENLNNYLKAICSLLILEDILKPIKILTPKKEANEKPKTSETNSKPNKLYEIAPDENTRKDIINTAVNHLIMISSTYADEKTTPTEIYNEFQKSLPSALEETKLTVLSEIELVGDYVWNLLVRNTLKVNGIDVENIDFEMIKEVFPLEGLLKFTSHYCNIDSLTKLREAIEKSRTPLTVELIVEWVELYHKQYGIYPKKNSGLIEFAHDTYKGATWVKIDSALRIGYRGLPGGSSLAKFLEENFGVKNIMNLPHFSNDLILEWIKSHYEKYNKHPNNRSGIIEFAEGEHKGTTWAHVDTALSEGLRGLLKGSSLPKFLEKNLGVKNNMNLPHFSNDLILEWIKSHYEKYNEHPNNRSGIIEFAMGEHKETTWAHVDTALQTGGRGLPKGSSLPKFLKENFGVKNIMNLPHFSNDLILEWIKLYYKKHGIYPNKDSGIIEFSTDEFVTETWAKINRALIQGGRGLSGGSSLAKLLEEKFGVRNQKNLPTFSKDLIIEWIKLFHAKHGRYPNRNSGVIESAKAEHKETTWAHVDTALKTGGRGLPKGSSLPKFLKENFGVRHIKALPLYTEDLIIEFLKEYHNKFGKYPQYKSGTITTSIKEYSDDTWASIDSALKRGSRGLSGGSSLAKFIKKNQDLIQSRDLLLPMLMNGQVSIQ